MIKEIVVPAPVSSDEFQCQHCDYWREIPKENVLAGVVGHCHRFPPDPVFDGDVIQSCFPFTRADQFCYEWQKESGPEE
jgi:hypothetical protein